MFFFLKQIKFPWTIFSSLEVYIYTYHKLESLDYKFMAYIYQVFLF